jgi:DNA-binding transcriptional LysR family regulator
MTGDVQIRQLEYVVALAREQHFGRAAVACHISQSALSTAIRKLEAELGVTIVERGHRFAGLTTEGARVVEWAERILAKRDALRSELSRTNGGLSATLRLGAIPTAARAIAILTGAFRARNPRARVRIETGATDEIRHRLADFTLDAGIVYLDPDTSHGRRRGHELYRERYVLLTAEDGPLGDRKTVDCVDVTQLPLCALTPAMQNRRMLDLAMGRSGVQLVPSVEADTVDALHAHLSTTRWSSIVADSWLHTFGVPRGMTGIPIADLDLRPVVGIITGDREPASMVAGALIDAARDPDVRAEFGHSTAAALPVSNGATGPRLAGRQSPIGHTRDSHSTS